MRGWHVYFDSRIDELCDVLGRVLPNLRGCIELRELCSRHIAVSIGCRFFIELRRMPGRHLFAIRLVFVH